MNRFTAGIFEPEWSGEKGTLKWLYMKLKDKKDLTIFDCGGNIGIYSKLVLEIFGRSNNALRLHIFEPSHQCAEGLIKDFGKLENVWVHQVAVSDESGGAELFYPWKGAGGASLSRDVSEAQGTGSSKIQSERIQRVTLDAFCRENKIDRIDFLKLDIEGYELAALKGGNELLKLGKIDYIQVEIGQASLATKCMLFDIWEMLNGSYHFYLILNRGMVALHYRPDLECFQGASNFLLELKEKPSAANS